MKNTAPVTEIENHSNLPANDNRYQPPLFDASLFPDDMKNFEITEEERIAMLKTLWSMMVSCVEKGFDSDSTNLIWGKLIQTAFEDAADSPLALESNEVANRLKARGLRLTEIPKSE
ncbi:MAG: hypothetical protein P8P30_11120 [Rickettsiales bacterium]|nr:hypothetical protein [Rickettsiales bacterium]